MQVETELLQEYETQLLEKEHSGCAALLQDDKVRAMRGRPLLLLACWCVHAHAEPAPSQLLAAANAGADAPVRCCGCCLHAVHTCGLGWPSLFQAAGIWERCC